MLFVLGKNQLKMYSCRRFIIHKHIFQSTDGPTCVWGFGACVGRKNLNQRPETTRSIAATLSGRRRARQGPGSGSGSSNWPSVAEQDGWICPVRSFTSVLFFVCPVVLLLLRLNHGLLTGARWLWTHWFLVLEHWKGTRLPAGGVAGAVHPSRRNQRSSATSPPALW